MLKSRFCFFYAILLMKVCSYGQELRPAKEYGLNGKWGFVDETDKEVIPFKYNKAREFSKSEGLASVNLNNKWGFIDKRGKEVIPIKYDLIGDFSEGLVPVKLNNKWGFVDKRDNEIIPIKYDLIGDFSEGFASIKLNNKWGFIDKRDNEVISININKSPKYLYGKMPIFSSCFNLLLINGS